MKKFLFVSGVLVVIIAVFAQFLGIDNDGGWGRGRTLILISGVGLILAGLFASPLWNKLMELKVRISTLVNSLLSYSAQIVLVSITAPSIIFITYIWFTQPHARDLTNNYGYYSELAIGFKAGNLYLAEKPSSTLLSLSNPYNYLLRKQYAVEDYPWDVSLYKDKFYVYWGPAPALILTIFGTEQLSHIEDYDLALTFAYGLFLYAALIAANFWIRPLQHKPIWILAVSMLVIGFSTPVTIMLKEARIYEAAIFGCQFFFIGGCYWAYSALSNNQPVLWKLALASLHWAFALGTRITILPVILFSAVVIIIYIFRVFKTSSPKTYLPVLAVIGVPLLLALFSLSWYNWARFGSIFEFGLKYQLTNVDYSVFKSSFSNSYIDGNLFNYFAYPIQLHSRFPYITRIEYQSSNDRLAGLIYISPYILLLFAPLIHIFGNFSAAGNQYTTNPKNDPPTNWLIATFMGSALIAMVIILSFYFVTIRYIEDFMPSLLLLITIQLGQEYQWLNQNNLLRKILALLILSLAGLTITANILLAIPHSGKVFMLNLLNTLSKILGLR